MLSPPQLEEMEAQGFVRLPGVFSQEAAAAMVERIWSTLARRGAAREEPERWPSGAVWKLQDLKRQQVFEPIGGEALTASLDQLLGGGSWHVPKHWGSFLISFPGGAPAWTVPHRVWHTDFGFRQPDTPLFGVLVFSFLADLPPRSGGTVVVSGSHRVVRRFVAQRPSVGREKMKFTRQALMQSDPWLRALSSEAEGEPRPQQFMDREHVIGDVPVRVVELCAEAGDVILGHPWLLHATAENAGREPRMMRVQRIHRMQPSRDETGEPDLPATAPRS